MCSGGLFFKEEKSSKGILSSKKWSSFGLIFMKLGIPEKLGTLGKSKTGGSKVKNYEFRNNRHPTTQGLLKILSTLQEASGKEMFNSWSLPR